MSYCFWTESAAMHACSLENDPFAALCVADPSFPRIALRYLIVFYLVKVVPFSISVASEVKGGFPLMVQLVLEALKFSPCASTKSVQTSIMT